MPIGIASWIWSSPEIKWFLKKETSLSSRLLSFNKNNPTHWTITPTECVIQRKQFLFLLEVTRRRNMWMNRRLCPQVDLYNRGARHAPQILMLPTAQRTKHRNSPRFINANQKWERNWAHPGKARAEQEVINKALHSLFFAGVKCTEHGAHSSGLDSATLTVATHDGLLPLSRNKRLALPSERHRAQQYLRPQPPWCESLESAEVLWREGHSPLLCCLLKS